MHEPGVLLVVQRTRWVQFPHIGPSGISVVCRIGGRLRKSDSGLTVADSEIPLAIKMTPVEVPIGPVDSMWLGCQVVSLGPKLWGEAQNNALPRFYLFSVC